MTDWFYFLCKFVYIRLSLLLVCLHPALSWELENFKELSKIYLGQILLRRSLLHHLANPLLAKLVNFLINFSVFQIHFVICYESYHNELDDFIKGFSKLFTSEKILNFFWTIDITTLKSLIEEQTGINEQGWKKVPPCFLIY